jgi:hypothetical protein
MYGFRGRWQQLAFCDVMMAIFDHQRIHLIERSQQYFQYRGFLFLRISDQIGQNTLVEGFASVV